LGAGCLWAAAVPVVGRATVRPACPAPSPAGTRCGPMWATTGKQCWRCGVIRERAYRVRALAHAQSPQRTLPARDSRTVAMKVGIR
jgi:hypothetical protein